MTSTAKLALGVVLSALFFSTACALVADDAAVLRKACIDGNGPGWRPLTLDDFVNVNCDADTWSMREGMIHCKGTPIGVARLNKTVRNFEMVLEWRHLKSAGNSGVFVWVSPEAIEKLNNRARLPERHRSAGARPRLLDELRAARRARRPIGSRPTVTSFPSGRQVSSRLPPSSPDGRRSFPRKNLSKGVGEWNHYYIRGINGEVRLWVNGEEVSGGSACHPAEGYLCLESEGSPIDFKNLRLRELP